MEINAVLSALKLNISTENWPWELQVEIMVKPQLLYCFSVMVCDAAHLFTIIQMIKKCMSFWFIHVHMLNAVL